MIKINVQKDGDVGVEIGGKLPLIVREFFELLIRLKEMNETIDKTFQILFNDNEILKMLRKDASQASQDFNSDMLYIAKMLAIMMLQSKGEIDENTKINDTNFDAFKNAEVMIVNVMNGNEVEEEE